MAYRDVLQGRTVHRLRQVVEFLQRYKTLPMGELAADGLRISGNGEMTQTSFWLKNNVKKLGDAETTPIRAALVRVGALAPRGDEDKYDDVMPDFLKDPSLLRQVDDGKDQRANVARSPRSKAKALTPNPFPTVTRPGGHFGDLY